MNLRDLVALFGHELRTPLAAILGYQELLADGIYGQLDPRQLEPVQRIHHSAEQILGLMEGLHALAVADRVEDDEKEHSDAQSLCNELHERLRPAALARNVTISADATTDPLPDFPTRRFLRAAEIAAVAALKSSPGRTIHIKCHCHNQLFVCTLAGTGLDASRDQPPARLLDPAENTPVTPAQLRLGLARALLAAAGGELRLEAAQATLLQLSLPCNAAPGAIDATERLG